MKSLPVDRRTKYMNNCQGGDVCDDIHQALKERKERNTN